MDVTAEDLQNATNGIINDLLVKTMNQGALIEAQARTISELEQEVSRLRKAEEDRELDSALAADDPAMNGEAKETADAPS